MSAVTPFNPTNDAVQLKRHGKSFWWASRCLTKQQRQPVKRLYNICRQLDDLADLSTNSYQATSELKQLKNALQAGHDKPAEARELLRLAHTYQFAVTTPIQFIDTLLSDQSLVRISDKPALLDYCFGVAGTVGLMMTALLGAPEEKAQAFAVDLGIAMQLTNIARDVLEDAANNRIYLPQSWLPADITTNSLLTADTPTRLAVFKAIKAVLELADEYYRSARAGMAYLPTKNRWSIAIAAEVYRAIGLKINTLNADEYWQHQRVVVSPAGKIRYSLAATAKCLKGSAYAVLFGSAQHNDNLHAEIKRLTVSVRSDV